MGRALGKAASVGTARGTAGVALDFGADATPQDTAREVIRLTADTSSKPGQGLDGAALGLFLKQDQRTRTSDNKRRHTSAQGSVRLDPRPELG